MKKEWTHITISYWTTNPKDYKRILKKVNNPLKGHNVSDVILFATDEMVIKKKPWWRLWR